MTRTYALKRLLEHGELSMAEIVGITRWSHKDAFSAARSLYRAGLVKYIKTAGVRRRVYKLANWSGHENYVSHA